MLSAQRREGNLSVYRKYVAVSVLMLLVGAFALTGCGAKPDGHSVAMAELGAMPADVMAAPQVVSEAYRFAAANPDTLSQIPCYCGCGAMGHQSNYNCFWQNDGKVDTHALGCGICVDIAQDVRRGLEQGRSLETIRGQIDADYSRFGPATDTPPVAVQSK